MKHKVFKAFVGIVSVAPILFLAGMVLSFFAYVKFPLPIFTGPEAANIFVAIGALLILVGTTLAFSAQRVSRIVTSPDYKATTSADLMQGPYGYSRHPGSLSLVIMYVGFALVVNSVAMLVFAGAIVLLLSFVFIPMQERAIGELTAAYADYKKKVRMWF